MHSPSAGWMLAWALGAWAGTAHAASEITAPLAASVGNAISRGTLDSAVAQLKLDPNLGGQSRVRTLKWTSPSQPRPPSKSPAWIVGFFDYVSQVGGVLLWIGGAIAVAVAAVWGYRYLSSHVPRTQTAESIPAAAVVLDLDISPDALPDDISAAALSLSRAGKMRESLSLLYRASLSRAVNRFGALIGPASTEREALSAVRGSLDEARARYVADVVRMWQGVVYAGDVVAHEDVAPLCARFGETLDGVSA